MRKLASIQKIIDIRPIERADKIEVATILGWEVVIRKDEFKPGDLCVYCEIDSILPEKPEFEFLRDRKFRIKTIRLKKQVSQGIAFPLSILPKKTNIVEDADVTEILGVKKYEPAESNQTVQYRKSTNPIVVFFMRYAWFRYLKAKYWGGKRSNFPDFIYKTDETRIQNMPNVFQKFNGTVCYVTEKLDGCSATYAIHKGKFYVCSRNIWLHRNDGSHYWGIAEALNIKIKLSAYGDIAIQGEIVGEGIQGNKYLIQGRRFYIFNVFDIKTQKYFDFNETVSFCSNNGFEMVPVLADNMRLHGTMTVKHWVDWAGAKSSEISSIMREGVVVREAFNRSLSRLSFKVINPNFLLKYDE